MCSTCGDDTYAAYGGKWERVDMTHGRVGSAFTPVGFDVGPIDDEVISAPYVIDGDIEDIEEPEFFEETDELEETDVMFEEGTHSVLRVD
jgi:hypothetical protein